MKELIPIETTATPYFRSLTGIRAVAAWLLFVYHFNPVAVTQARFIHHLINEAHVGVSIFFVLSGFLISLRYREVTFNTKNWVIYFRNRVARVYPLYFILTTVTFLYWAWSGATRDFPWGTYFLNITFLKGFSNDLKFTGIAQGWSLTVEETFYLLAPFIFWLAKRRNLFIQPLIILTTLLFIGFSMSGFSTNQMFEHSFFLLIYTFLGRCFEFYVGIQLAVLIQQDSRPRKGIQFTGAGLIWMLVCVVGMAFVSYPVTISFYKPMGILINNVLFPIGVAMLFFGLIKERSWLGTFLASRFMQLFGKSSYAFYLIHIGIFQLLISQWVSGNPLVLFLILNIAALVLYAAVEKPLQKRLRPKETI